MDKFREAQNWLLELVNEAQFFRAKTLPTLDTVNRFLDELGRPDEFFEYRIVIGGTAGKGTLCRMTEAALLAAGESVATLISPHVQVMTERIRINGKLIAPEAFAEAVSRIRSVAERIRVLPTYYEAIVLAGIVAAQKAKCKILICEVGLGGEWDAVNAVRGPRIAVVTFIGDDHREILGRTLQKIAETKAGIFTKDSVLDLSFEQKFCSILQRKSKRKIQFPKGKTKDMNIFFVQKIGEKILGKKETKIPSVSLPARWEVLHCHSERSEESPEPKILLRPPRRTHQDDRKVILDGAHSAPRFAFILPKLQALRGKKIGVLAMTRNHDAESFRIILPAFDEVIWTTVPGEREFWSPAELKEKFGLGVCVAAPLKAFEKACSIKGTVVITGSFYLCGVIRDLFYAPEKILEQRTEFPS